MALYQDDNPVNKYETNDYLALPCRNPNFLTPEECNNIIEMGKNLDVIEGTVDPGNADAHGRLHLLTRSSRIRWLRYSPETHWLFERFRDAINIANGKYRFDLDAQLSVLQIAEYSVGCHYTWHSDIGVGPTSFRKLSLTVQLSDPDDYNGGDLEFRVKASNDKEQQRKQGTAIIFPSFQEHRVTVVTRGTRWSIVAWITGPPFR